MGARRNLNEDFYNAALMHALEDTAEKQDLADSAILDQYMDAPHLSVRARWRKLPAQRQ